MYCVCGIILQEYEFELACFPESDCLHQKLLKKEKRRGKRGVQLVSWDVAISLGVLSCYIVSSVYTHTCDICLVAVFPAAAV